MLAAILLAVVGDLRGTTTAAQAASGDQASTRPVRTTLESFRGGADGAAPLGGLVMDDQGNLFGTTSQSATGGGPVGNGTVFKLSPPSIPGGRWTKKLLYQFKGNTDGYYPTTRLVWNSRTGGLIGSSDGGLNMKGLAFALNPPAPGGKVWSKTDIWSFTGGPDGDGPISTLTLDPVTGDLFGAAEFGGSASSNGAIFQLNAPASAGGAWTAGSLDTAMNYDPASPVGGLARDAQSGALYGTAYFGGRYGAGYVFQLVPPALSTTGFWQEIRLYAFQGAADGLRPIGDLARDASTGDLYGTAQGTVIKVSPPAVSGGAWTETVLYSFTDCGWGDTPTSGVILAGTGHLYGVAKCGGALSHGVVFGLSAPASGSGRWKATILYNFRGGTDGDLPNGELLIDASSGAIYGTTSGGGAYGKGTVFKLVP